MKTMKNPFTIALLRSWAAILCTLLCLFAPYTLKAEQTPQDTLVRFETTQGEFVVRLYRDTPLHRQNFLRLVREGFYEGVLFHRVIPNFMAQAGDPTSRTAPKGALLGEGDNGYSLPAEIRFPQHFHHRGALAAARESDEVNPTFRSSGCQFYVVTGTRFSSTTFQKMQAAVEQKIGCTYPDSVISVYQEQGGTPWLDGTYTVFGEVVSGMDTIELIIAMNRDENNRPHEDIRILRAVIVPPCQP